jgi:hypothetical protein
VELRFVRGDEATERVLIAVASCRQQLRLLCRRCHSHLEGLDVLSEVESSVARWIRGAIRV